MTMTNIISYLLAAILLSAVGVEGRPLVRNIRSTHGMFLTCLLNSPSTTAFLGLIKLFYTKKVQGNRAFQSIKSPTVAFLRMEKGSVVFGFTH